MEGSEEDETEVSFKEEDEVVDLCSTIIVEYWGIISEISQICIRNVPTVWSHIILLNIVCS